MATATTLPSAISASIAEAWARVRELQLQVERDGACSLPGVSIKFDLLVPLVQRAVARGFVSAEKGRYVLHGLRWGFDLGVDVESLKGGRWFTNYKSALEARSAVTEAVAKRVRSFKTVALCPFDRSRKAEMPVKDYRVFPMGAVPKPPPAAPGEVRPVSDHTKSGLKAATDLDGFRHSLNTYDEIAACLRPGFGMRMSDVDNAFPLLPLACRLWPFFLFLWWPVDAAMAIVAGASMVLYMHVCGDFGAAGLPGTWKMFFTDVMVGVARSEGVLTLPMPIYVDDCALIGGDLALTDAEGVLLRDFLHALGIFMKVAKDRAAATLQLALGFWWDSVARTRTLEAGKLALYLKMLDALADRRSLELREMQSAAGRMQRAIMTLPRGAACFLAALFAMMRGLSLPWQSRRMSRAVRADFRAIAMLLRLNMGRGFFCFDHMPRAPEVYTDASKESRYAGGGYVSMCGRYRWWVYGSSAARRPIDCLEGDAVLMAARDLKHLWKGCVVPLHIDNRSFQLSAAKGWSRADRLCVQLRELFAIAVEVECVYEFHWISTVDNIHADALSRANGLATFLRQIVESGLLLPGAKLEQHASSGAVRQFGSEFPSDAEGDGPSRSVGASQASTVPASRASIYVGLPTQPLVDRLDSLMDNRLAASSRGSVSAALSHWQVVAARHRWSLVIPTDDPSRGGKLATFIVYLLDETELVGSSIMNYIWALRTYMKLSRQMDPSHGIMEWTDFIRSVEVETWMPAEPRRAVPMELLRTAIAAVDVSSFEQVQMVVLVLMLLFSFARSETPLPKTLDGVDPMKHLLVCDVGFGAGPVHTRIRLKSTKSDPRMERDAARHNEDWVLLGDVPGDAEFSLLKWMQLLFALHAGRRDASGPFFVHVVNRQQPLTYSAALKQFRSFLELGGCSADEAPRYGLHGLRVEGYNRSKRSVGVELTVAHGGWESTAHERYERFSFAQVLAISGAMVASAPADVPPAPVLQVEPPAAPPPPPPPPPSPPARHVRRVAVTPATAAPVVALQPLVLASCVGRVVLVPKSLWPAQRYRCYEHGGEGWEGRILEARASDGMVKVSFATASGGARRWLPVWLELSCLRPI